MNLSLSSSNSKKIIHTAATNRHSHLNMDKNMDTNMDRNDQFLPVPPVETNQYLNNDHHIYDHPPSLSSNNNSNNNNRIFDSIEQQEQDLIRHIHTSGLKTPRETSLVDEVMNIRKERRRLFAKLLNSSNSLEEINKTLIQRVKISEEAYKNELESKVEERTSELELKVRHLSKILDANEYQLNSVKSDQESTISKEKRKLTITLNKQYENKVKVLDEKFQELSSAQRRKDTTIAEKIAQDLLIKAKEEIENNCKIKIDKYKDVIKTITEREKDIENVIGKYNFKLKSSELEIISLKQRLAKSTEHIENNLKKEKEYLSKIDSLSDVIIKSKLTIEKMKSEATQNLKVVENIENQHNDELAKVDAKVRAVLKTRDNIIDDLKLQLKKSEAKSNEADKVLRALNDGISCGSSRSRINNN